jgi:hypothetical protein
VLPAQKSSEVAIDRVITVEEPNYTASLSSSLLLVLPLLTGPDEKSRYLLKNLLQGTNFRILEASKSD